VQLPGRSGPETLEALQRLRPGLPAVFVSGDPGEAAATGRPILRKPVEPEAVLRAVRRALDGVR
jgi:FixJ family two-component response regulator